MVTLADGALTLEVAPESLDFGVGVENTIVARQVPLTELPTYLLSADQPARWALPEAIGAAFLVNPVKITSMTPISLSVNEALAGLPPSPPNTVYDVYAVNPETAIARRVGGATRDADGRILGDPDLDLRYLSVLILMRR